MKIDFLAAEDAMLWRFSARFSEPLTEEDRAALDEEDRAYEALADSLFMAQLAAEASEDGLRA